MNLSDDYLLKILESARDQYSIKPIMDLELYGKIEQLCKEYLGEEEYFEFYVKLEELESMVAVKLEEIVFVHGVKTGIRIILASVDKLDEGNLTD